MTDITGNTPDQILQRILGDGVVDEREVRLLENYVREDWVVDRPEVELLFRVNFRVGQNDKQCPAWTEFFKNTVARLIIMDLDSPGEIDENEGDWLEGVLAKYSIQNDTQAGLFQEIKRMATLISGKVAYRFDV